MNTKQSNPVIEQLHAAGLNMSLGDDGKVLVNNPAQLTDDLRDLIRSNKPMLIDWLRTAPATVAANDPATDPGKTGTRRPPGLSKKLLAASQALDEKIVAAGLSLTPPEAPKPKLAASNPAKASAKPTPPAKVEAEAIDWKPLAYAYHQHHFKCVTCITAGKGTKYGPRCGVGAALWTGYQNAIS